MKETFEPISAFHDTNKNFSQYSPKEKPAKTEEEEDVLENVIKSFEKNEAFRKKTDDFLDPLQLMEEFEASEQVISLAKSFKNLEKPAICLEREANAREIRPHLLKKQERAAESANCPSQRQEIQLSRNGGRATDLFPANKAREILENPCAKPSPRENQQRFRSWTHLHGRRVANHAKIHKKLDNYHHGCLYFGVVIGVYLK